MRRLFLLISLILASFTPVLAQNSGFTGTLEVAHGKIRNSDGTYRDIKGLRLPYRAERIKATKMSKYAMGQKGGSTMPAGSSIFNADAGSGYGVIDGPDPSSL